MLISPTITHETAHIVRDIIKRNDLNLDNVKTS